MKFLVLFCIKTHGIKLLLLLSLWHIFFFCYRVRYFLLSFQDRGILSVPLNPKNTEAGYILSLGVSAPHRRNGIASLLLDNLIAHLTTVEHKFCRAIFLHVLTTNTPAIRFYESRNFKWVQIINPLFPPPHSLRGSRITCREMLIIYIYIFFCFRLQSFLPYYYLIKGRCKDGFTYVLYINGGHPPWGPCEYLVHYCKALCNSQPFS